MKTTATTTTERYERATSQFPAGPASRPRGIGVLADACGGLFWGYAKAEALVIERLSGNTPDAAQPTYSAAA